MIVLAVLVLMVMVACERLKTVYVPIEVIKVVPPNIKIEKYPWAVEEIKNLIDECGAGVIQKADGSHVRLENKCGHTVAVDELLLTHPTKKTGYLHEEDWPYKKGVQFISATDEEIAAVPEYWDLKDRGPMIRIHRQGCGNCWATSSRAMLEQLIATHDGKLIPLSSQTTLSRCCTWCGSCNGGYMSTPDWFSKDKENLGLPLLPRDPEVEHNTSCKFTDDELENEMDYLVESSPYVGSSLSYSRFYDANSRPDGQKVKNTQALMIKHKSAALVTISALSQSKMNNPKPYMGCSKVNSGGNHMEIVSGWYQYNDRTIARVQNSWGTGHGAHGDGFTHLKWECSPGRLNRGLGRSTRVGIYKPECTNLADAYLAKPVHKVMKGNYVVLGRPGTNDQYCDWTPGIGIIRPLSNDGCQILVQATDKSVEYHLTAKEDTCHTQRTAMTLVEVWGPANRADILVTPHGEVELY